MATLKQDTSFGPGVYRGKPFTKALLEEYAESTNRAIAAGIPIPLLKRHAPIDANDSATQQFADVEGVGWVKRVGVNDQGALWWEADGVPADVEQAVKDKRHRYTSPEFRPRYESDKKGVFSGKLIRHIAFSIRPGNPQQGPIESTMALDESETSWQFDETERKPLEESAMPTTQHDEDDTPKDAARSRADSEAPLEDKGNPDDLKNNPDAPPKATDRSKLSAVIAGLAQKNIVLPSDFDFGADGAIDILVAAINSSIAAENKAKAEAEPADSDNEPVTDAPMPFDELTDVNSSGQGHDAGHSKHPLHSTFEQHGYKYSHTTPIKRKDGSSYKLHTYKHPTQDHRVSIQDGSQDWSGGKGGSGHRHSGTGVQKLAAYLKRKTTYTSQHDEQSTSFGEDAIMFTPEEIAAAPEQLRKKMEEQNRQLKDSQEKVQQFDEERRTALNNSSRDKAVADVTAAKIPPGLKTKLLAGYQPAKDGETASIQFDEGEEQPTFTAVQVAQMVAESLPPNMQFDEQKVGEAPAPKGQKLIGYDAKGSPVYGPATTEQFFESDEGAMPSGHVSDEDAERLVAANPVFGGHARKGVRTSLADDVAAETRRNPSRMVEDRR